MSSRAGTPSCSCEYYREITEKTSHFATFPPDLVKPCILAGSRPGDVILDPFMGAGTVAMVAQDLGRRWLGCELNPDYAAMAERRSRQTGLVLTPLTEGRDG